ncbi:MAG: hypothetical protein COB53_05790 [Elusimicrobia bacterium]|nr:MAG: hypothetical protein COB53_05790 [Elusimicrobiota bacterium]
MKNTHTKTKPDGTQRRSGAVLRFFAAGALSLLALFSPLCAKADINPANDSASFVIRVLPQIDLGVVVDTSGAAWIGSSDLSMTPNLGSQQRLGTPVTLTIVGNLNNQELTLSALALDTWTVDTDASATEQNALQIYALVGRDQTGVLATDADYDTGTSAHLITTSDLPVGQPIIDEGAATGNNFFEFIPADGAKYDDVDNMKVGTVRKLWMSTMIPSDVTVEGEQKFQITVQAVFGADQ